MLDDGCMLSGAVSNREEAVLRTRCWKLSAPPGSRRWEPITVSWSSKRRFIMYSCSSLRWICNQTSQCFQNKVWTHLNKCVVLTTSENSFSLFLYAWNVILLFVYLFALDWTAKEKQAASAQKTWELLQTFWKYPRWHFILLTERSV